jgi:osmotically-inducible protein OsmY
MDGAARAGATQTSGGVRRGRPCIVAVLGFLVVISGCATLDPWEDPRIESEVKARLVAEHDANLTRLGVVSRQATVYLSGTVESADQKALAEAVAKGVRGVKRVVSTLEVRSRSR